MSEDFKSLPFSLTHEGTDVSTPFGGIARPAALGFAPTAASMTSVPSNAAYFGSTKIALRTQFQSSNATAYGKHGPELTRTLRASFLPDLRFYL